MDNELAQLSKEFISDKLSTLTSETFTRYALRRARDGVGPATLMHNLATVRTVLNAAKPMFGLAIDGALVREALAALSRMGVVAKSRSVTRRTRPEELAALDEEFARIATHPSTILPMQTIVPLAIALPRRRSELVSALWEDYDRKAGTLVLRDTKNPVAPRLETVPVPPAAAAIINALPVIDARILPYEGESISASFERACKRLGIEHLRFHDLRHEGISRLFEMGLDIPEVALISGHLTWATLKRYTHLKPAQVLEKINAHLKET
jgi:integrase